MGLMRPCRCVTWGLFSMRHACLAWLLEEVSVRVCMGEYTWIYVYILYMFVWVCECVYVWLFTIYIKPNAYVNWFCLTWFHANICKCMRVVCTCVCERLYCCLNIELHEAFSIVLFVSVTWMAGQPIWSMWSNTTFYIYNAYHHLYLVINFHLRCKPNS